MTMQVIWNGTQEERDRLLAVIQKNCVCTYSPIAIRGIRYGERTFTCGAHSMLVHDQRALDGLVFMRRQRERLIVDEFVVEPYRVEQ